MLIRLTSIRPKFAPVNEIADLLSINYENAKTICRRYKSGSIALKKLQKSSKCEILSRKKASHSKGDKKCHSTDSEDDDDEENDLSQNDDVSIGLDCSPQDDQNFVTQSQPVDIDAMMESSHLPYDTGSKRLLCALQLTQQKPLDSVIH